MRRNSDLISGLWNNWLISQIKLPEDAPALKMIALRKKRAGQSAKIKIARAAKEVPAEA